MTMAVNVSARQLRNHGIVGPRPARAVRVRASRAARSTLELTESTLMENPTGAPEVLGRLKALGVDLAIDDFGTGYSSLAYLRGFPVDTVKIDRAFVMNVDGPDSADATLVAAIVAMADALGIATIAEGVESETQAERLLELGCGLAQGFLYSRPAAGRRRSPTRSPASRPGPAPGCGRCATRSAPERRRAAGRRRARCSTGDPRHLRARRPPDPRPRT